MAMQPGSMEDSDQQFMYVLKIQGIKPENDRIQVRDSLFDLVVQGPLPMTDNCLQIISRHSPSQMLWETIVAGMPYGEMVRVATGQSGTEQESRT